MADVERGQLILVTALTIAVSLVALVLLLNTVIYAENLATRGADVGGQDAVEYRGAVVSGVGGAIDAENELAYDDYDDVRENVNESIERVDSMLARQHVTRAELVEISNVTLTDGAYLAHPEDTGNFSSAGNDSDWTLASDVEATRGFAFVLDDTTLAGSRSDAFRITVDNGSAEWHAYVYDVDGDVTVEVGNETDVWSGCSTEQPDPRLDLTAGTLAGDPCSGLTFGEGVSGPYAIEFANAHDAGGTYELTVLADPDTNGAIPSNFNGPGSDTAPYYGHAIYDATVDLRYHTDALRFTDRVRVAPGESA